MYYNINYIIFACEHNLNFELSCPKHIKVYFYEVRSVQNFTNYFTILNSVLF